MEPRFAAPAPQIPGQTPPERDDPSAASTAASRPAGGRPLMLALAVHWDDCSVAIGNRDAIQAETWSQQPERGAVRPGPAAAAVGGSPVASRDALLLLDRLLARSGIALADLGQLCFARGPGAFTSLRVAAGLVQGLSLATAVPVAGICSLAALIAHEPGWREHDEGRRWLQLSALDARMGECYFAAHLCRGGEHPEAVLEPAVGSPARAIAAFEAELARHCAIEPILAGNAFRLLPELAGWAQRKGSDPQRAGRRVPTAEAVLAVAASAGAPTPGPARTALPVYVRDKIALDVAEQRASAAARALAGTSRARA